MNRLFLAFSLLAAGIVTAPLPAAPDAAAKSQCIDVAICLDTSNSMDGLIASAKAKLWDIVNNLAKAKPTPNLRVSLYSYGNDGYDRNIGWVRKELDFTTDLDAVYQKLNNLTTRGGTELVARVCRDALVQQKWAEDKNALRLIFVCGNEPASQDKEVSLSSVADIAKSKNVVINPIFCGPDKARDATDWKEFAALAGGRFASINQDKGTVAIATPQDKELAELSVKLNSTYVMYGRQAESKKANQTAQDKNAAQAGGAVAASRADAKAGRLYRNSDWDLVDRKIQDPNFDISKVPEDELCDELKKMKPEERVAHVKKKQDERLAIQKEIQDLSTKRQAYITEETKKNPSSADKAFDAAIKEVLREQAKAKGIEIPD